MALVNCKECGKQVSKKAEACPHCGARLKSKRQNSGCGPLALLALILVIGASVIGETNRPSSNPAPAAKKPEKKAPPPEPRSPWSVASRQSKIDDSTNVYVSTEARGTIPGTIGVPVRPTLWISCRENTTRLYVAWDRFVTTQDTVVTYRIDSQPARKRRWNMSTDHESTGLWSGGAAIPFVKSLFDTNQVLFRVTPHGDSAVTATFDTDGLAEKIKPLREACHW